MPSVIYEPTGHRWWLWWPCQACGGTKLPLRDRGDFDRSSRVRTVRLAEADDQSCPGCETLRRRREHGRADPAVWYDALFGDWVVRVPCGTPGDSALLPLEIRWFDAPWAQVYRAASDIVYAHDAFETAAKTSARDPRPADEVDGVS